MTTATTESRDGTTLHAPTLHMNGSPRDHLTEPLLELYSALSEAFERSRQCNPNMRDYYIHADGIARYDAAVARVRSWQQAIETVRLQIEADLEAIEKQEGR